MAFVAIEMTPDDGSGSSLGISQEQGSAEVTYRLFGDADQVPPTPDQINEFLNYWNGGVQSIAPVLVAPGVGAFGRIDRVLPPVHNFRPELSASAVKSFVGKGTNTAADSTEILGLPETSFTFPNWEQYEAKVEYTKRPYFLLANEDVAVKADLDYWPVNGSSYGPIIYAEEWTRFTQTTRAPLNDTASATFGMMRFCTDSNLAPGGDPGGQFGQQVYIYLQNQAVEMNWFLVPYRYVLDLTIGGLVYRSYLNRFVNTVNQYDWNGFPAGSLLYLGATPTPYIPSNPTSRQQQDALGAGLSQNLLCNLKLKFVYTGRVGTDVPAADNPLFTNRNNIAAGHNLFANFADRRFYYVASAAADPANRRAAFQSFPFQLLFTDPLLLQPGGLI